MRPGVARDKPAQLFAFEKLARLGLPLVNVLLRTVSARDLKADPLEARAVL